MSERYAFKHIMTGDGKWHRRIDVSFGVWRSDRAAWKWLRMLVRWGQVDDECCNRTIVTPLSDDEIVVALTTGREAATHGMELRGAWCLPVGPLSERTARGYVRRLRA